MKKKAYDSVHSYSFAHIEENLDYTHDGRFILRVEGEKDYWKELTPQEAEAWIKKHYPKYSWKRMVKHAIASIEHHNRSERRENDGNHA